WRLSVKQITSTQQPAPGKEPKPPLLDMVHVVGTKVEPLIKSLGVLIGGVGLVAAALLVDWDAKEQKNDEFCIGSLQLFSAREFKPDDVISPVAVRIVTERCRLTEIE